MTTKDIATLLGGSFMWGETTEGYEFWNVIHKSLFYSKSLLSLPASEDKKQHEYFAPHNERLTSTIKMLNAAVNRKELLGTEAVWLKVIKRLKEYERMSAKPADSTDLLLLLTKRRTP